SERSLVTLFGVSLYAIYHVIKLWKSNHTFDSRPRSGRLEVLSRSEKRYILLMVFRFPSKKYDRRFINLKNYTRANITIIVGGRSELIIIERDLSTLRHSYIA
ncbi:uncharacterized protein P884DRAFT_322614, partial [Thermothelomyces heterothallicus CBS 202.75]|uniref:uncharacterized protein n=1 Tax=Thermothelomyces heterothallicus CBS 202.75 TaxID=1149848 RepID=UPI003743E999